jgi:hypothetical protein
MPNEIQMHQWQKYEICPLALLEFWILTFDIASKGKRYPQTSL